MTIINNEAELREYTRDHLEVFDSELSRNGYIKDFKPKEYPFGLIEYINIEAECGVSYIAVYPSAFPQPKIKKLEWEKLGESGTFVHYEAFTLLRRYSIFDNKHTQKLFLAINGNSVGSFPTLEAAKAAAQEHFETIVKSCLINNGE